jgi:hypothetical protein
LIFSVAFLPLTSIQRWPGESGQEDKWIFCLRAARIAADQERR